MGDLVAVVGVSGVGKTALVRALAETQKFKTAFEQHAGRPFQALFKQDPRYALANQIDYLLLRAAQALMDQLDEIKRAKADGATAGARAATSWPPARPASAPRRRAPRA